MPLNQKPVALVTGANKGIGLQIAKDLDTAIQRPKHSL
jgi:NAD(P)-dependent dehydrogenase (short-subunit alcohol dehydrogenase family)